MLKGITHTADGTPRIRETKVLKVSIGVPKGRACYIYTHQGRWIIKFGVFNADKKLTMETALDSAGQKGFATRKEAQEWYAANRLRFAVSNRPQKIPFFTFTRRQVIDVGGKPEESFEPDWDAIESHGDTPREIDIVFMGVNPLFQEFQMWSKTALQCHGDGANALRLVKLGNEKWAGWKEAVAAKQDYFPVSECWQSGLCPYAAERACKPMSTLTFQLANNIRLGSTAYFTSTGIQSAVRLFSSLSVIESVAERAGSSIANTPMRLVVAPFQSNFGGIAATQYAVSVELRSQDVDKLRALLEASAWRPAVRQLETVSEDTPEVPQLTAGAMHGEFYEDSVEFEDDEPEIKSDAAAATQTSTAVLEAKLAAERKKREEKKTPADPPFRQDEAIKTAGWAKQEMAQPEPDLAAQIMAASKPAEVKPEPENEWPARCNDTFFKKIGPVRYQVALLAAGLPAASDHYVTEENHNKVWEEMNKQKAAVEREKRKIEIPGNRRSGTARYSV